MGGSASTSFNVERDIPELHGKVAIVTGGSGGLGFAIMQHLARKGAKVYMAVRDDNQTAEAFLRLKKEGLELGNGEVIFHELDLVDPRLAKKSAEEFMSRENRLDILINNAALLNDHGKANLNKDGISETMSTNVLGPFVFTRTLLPLLESTAALSPHDVRIVNVGSSGHSFTKDPRFGTRKDWNNEFKSSLLPSFSRYVTSKMAVHLWSNGLSRHLKDSGSNVQLLISHPGPVLSDGTKTALRTLYLSSLWIYIAGFLMQPPTIAAYSSVFAAASPLVNEKPDIYGGAYIIPPNIVAQQAVAALNPVKQKELWDFIEQHLDEIGV